MRLNITFLFIFAISFGYGQEQAEDKSPPKVRFRYIEPQFHFGSFLKSNATLEESGLLDNGYGAFTFKLGWQPSDSSSWAARYGYPSYGLGFYSGYLSDAAVFGNPNALYAFINFPLSRPSQRTSFSIEPSFGLTYNLVPYDELTNPVNTAIGARVAVYFNVEFRLTHKWTREVDLIYGIDFTHFSNGSTFQPNSGLNLYGITLGMSYFYNRDRKRDVADFYGGETIPARFDRPPSSKGLRLKQKSISIYLGGSGSQNKALAGTKTLKSTFSALLEYEHRFTEKHGIAIGTDLFFDDRLEHKELGDQWLIGLHTGYDFYFYNFLLRMQIGTYLSDDRGKGNFFMRPALRYQFSKHFFAQLGLKTLNGGAADYIEAGIGWKPFVR